jgi:LDH2 family malate/lactate/ureidoglycolate dehydrogenase
MKAGGIDSSAQPEVVAEGTSWAIIDGHCCMGMLSCSRAMNLALTKAHTCTTAWVGVRNSSHFGAAGYYANMAVAKDMIGVALSNADPNMGVPGARGHVIGNNPFSYAVPAGEEFPPLLDIALSAVAAGKIYAKKARGEAIPLNWITDADGLPTTNAAQWPYSGSMVPMAGHKGYGIAFLIEVLAGVLTGAGLLSEAKSWMWDTDKPARLGQSFIAINVGNIIPIEAFKQRVDRLIREIRQAPKAKGSERIYAPGEMEWENRAWALKNGIPLPEQILADLHRVGEQLGVDTHLLQ